MNYIIIIILLVLSAFFSASETAFSTVSRIRLRAMAEDGSRKAALALKIAESYDRTLTTILIGNNVVNIFSASLAAIIFTELFGSAGVGISTAVLTVLVLIFGEILPKSLAKENAEKFALFAGGMLNILIIILTPFSALFMAMKNVIAKSDDEVKPSVTEDELKYLIEEIEEQGVLEEHETELVRSALELDEKKVGQIIVPRVKVCAVERHTDYEGLKRIFLDEGYSRIPVYDHSIDNIVGIVTEKDFFAVIASDKDDDGSEAEDIMQRVLHFSELMTVSDALREMQRNKQHIAVVNDQYGGTAGIITLEDIMEELVGEIYDETDEPDRTCIKLGGGRFEVDALMPISDLEERTGIERLAENTQSNTAGGWASELFGRIPAKGDEISDGRIRVIIKDADESHIKRLIIEIKESEENGNLS